MSEDLLRKLQLLEEDYFGQPLVGQQADLREINQIRSQLGMPLVDARLNDIAAAVEEDVEEAQPEPAEVQDHTEAREVYQAYLKKLEELEAHRAYAEQVAEATAGPGQTPVRPLATLGTNGGPLLCDHCGKPIVLEGGRFHGVTADAAWKENPSDHWTSWILGGMVVEIQTNGTLRIYHGYPGRNDNHCCNVASREHDKAWAERGPSKGSEKKPKILAFIEQEFPDMTSEEHLDLLHKILDTMYAYDPGIGINRPSRKS
ncbi:MAG TPA: hypothetical protein VEL76_13000 [Gemmataceae bacterium]|nr:hypothetical protein [Gemmataceae bacterium]